MKIESNIGKVIEQLTRVRVGILRARFAFTNSGAYWRERATEVATATLTLIATPEQFRHVEGIVATTIDTIYPGPDPGFELKMSAKPRSILGVDIVGMTEDAPRSNDEDSLDSLPLWRDAFMAQKAEAYKAIEYWVKSGEKDLTADETDLDEVVANIYEIIFSEDGRTDLMDEARASLLKTDDESSNPKNHDHPHLIDSVRKRAAASSLDAATAEVWLLEVLAAWRKMILREWRAKFWQEYHAANPKGV